MRLHRELVQLFTNWPANRSPRDKVVSLPMRTALRHVGDGIRWAGLDEEFPGRVGAVRALTACGIVPLGIGSLLVESRRTWCRSGWAMRMYRLRCGCTCPSWAATTVWKVCHKRPAPSVVHSRVTAGWEQAEGGERVRVICPTGSFVAGIPS